MLTKTVAWIALLVSLAAIGVAWLAYNRTGVNLTGDIQTSLEENTREFRAETRLALAKAEARARLLALRADLAARRNWDQAAQEVSEIRGNLNEAYRNAEMETSEEFRGMDTNLEGLERNIRNESAESLEGLQGLIENLQQNIRTDEQ
jgi:short-subunit dehydrogenase involved in D-alanine esterification of teichoic acids